MGQRWTNDGKLVETDSGGGFFENIFNKGGNLLKAAFEAKYPEISNILSGENSVLSGDGSTYDPSKFPVDGTNYQATTGYNPNEFTQNTTTTLSGDGSTFEGDLPTNIGSDDWMSRNTVDNVVVDQKDNIEEKLNVTDIVKDQSQGGSGKKIANQIKDENNLVDAFGDDPINDMLGYAMKNMFGGWGGPKPNRYQIPMMNTAQRGLKY